MIDKIRDLLSPNKDRSQEKHSFNELWATEPKLAQSYIMQLSICGVVFIIGIILGILARKIAVFLFITLMCVGYAASVLIKIQAFLNGTVSAYSGTVIRVESTSLKMSEGMRFRPFVVIRNENNAFITFYPSNKNHSYKEGDILTIYAPDSAFMETGKDSCTLSIYYYIKRDGYETTK